MKLRGFFVGVLFLTVMQSALASVSSTSTVDTLKQAWMDAKYTQTGAAQKEAFADLSVKAAAMQQDFPADPAVRLWRGTILSSYASAIGGRQALGLLTQARDLLEASIVDAPDLEQGFAYGVLGALYYRVPAWPLSFRDTVKARKYLEKGVALYPDNPDLHYFYGDFLRTMKDYAGAQYHLELSLEKGPSPGRRVEIETALLEVERHLPG